MPNGNINSDALDSLFDPKGNVVLEQFEDSAYGTTAVLLRPESAAYRAQTGLGDPYVVAYGYDKEVSNQSVYLGSATVADRAVLKLKHLGKVLPAVQQP